MVLISSFIASRYFSWSGWSLASFYERRSYSGQIFDVDTISFSQRSGICVTRFDQLKLGEYVTAFKLILRARNQLFCAHFCGCTLLCIRDDVDFEPYGFSCAFSISPLIRTRTTGHIIRPCFGRFRDPDTVFSPNVVYHHLFLGLITTFMYSKLTRDVEAMHPNIHRLDTLSLIYVRVSIGVTSSTRPPLLNILFHKKASF